MFSEGLAAVRMDGKWGYVDKIGQMALLPQYESATEFSEGLAAVKVGDKWGFIDKTGQMVIPPQFFVRYYPSFADYHFFGGVARVWVGKELAYIDVKGKFVWGPVKERPCYSCWIELPRALIDR